MRRCRVPSMCAPMEAIQSSDRTNIFVMHPSIITEDNTAFYWYIIGHCITDIYQYVSYMEYLPSAVVVTVDGVVMMLQKCNWHYIITMRCVLDIGGGWVGYHGSIKFMHQSRGVMMDQFFFSPTRRALLSLSIGNTTINAKAT